MKYLVLSVLLLLTLGPAGLEGPIGRSTVGAASIYSRENTQETEILTNIGLDASRIFSKQELTT